MFQRALYAAAAMSLMSAGAYAVTFNDAVADNFDGNANMDISSVSVTNTATDITFTINLTGDIAANNWGKYCIGIDKNPLTGDTSAPVGNPWGRNINMADGMDAWVGSWVDGGGGAQAWSAIGAPSVWSQNQQVVPTLTTNSTSFTLSLAALGLSSGGAIHFDVYSTGGGGGDSANDASSLATQSTTGWSGPYTTPAGGGHSYNIVVPEPTTLGLVAGASVLGLRRRK